jgi:hypothetical protein
MAKKEFVVFTLEADSHGHSIGHGRWKEWGAGETEIQNRSELVKSVQKSAKKSNGCVKVRKRFS